MSIDLIRGVLAGILFMIGLMLWNAWQAEHPAPTLPAATISAASTAAVTTGEAVSVASPVAVATKVSTTPVSVSTDVLQVKIDPAGGALINAKLPQYPVSLQDKSPFELLNTTPESFYTAISGLSSPQGPDYKTAGIYQVEKTSYSMAPNQATLVVPLTWKNSQGLTVTKTFTFHRNSYAVDVAFTVTNHGNMPWTGQMYAQLKRADITPQHRGMFQVNPFSGAILSSPDQRYQKFSYDALVKNPVSQTITNGWMAFEQHYFITAWIPDARQPYQFSSQVFNQDKLYAMNMSGSAFTVAPGQSQTLQSKLYIGPSIPTVLKDVAPGLEKTVDYGWLWPISIILFWIMDHIHDVVGNWGWSIILLTVFVKLCFYQLSATSFRSMAAMRKLQPQLQQIRERYGDDRQKVGQLTMELYKKEKVNPIGGCLPLLVQIPVFIALYWVLLESVQLRLAPFALWIHDLSAADPYYILPILMGASMLVQQKMSPPPPDPMQAKLMMAMPVVFTFFFLNFPSGLVLYWLVSNVLSIAQQWFITKRYEKQQPKAKKKK
jgi:YidC/Oxa1 family membrane protein insertase